MKHILLIEDNDGDVRLIQHVITETTLPVRFTIAQDGEQAIHMLQESQLQPDLIILDLNIPKVPGLAVLERCKPTAPVVVFSSSSNPTERQQAKELGVRDFVQKPIDLDEFTKVITGIVENWVKPGVTQRAATGDTG